MKKGFLVITLVILFFCGIPNVLATNHENNMFIKISLVESGNEYEWEYDNPNKYEYEVGETVIKGERAEKEFIKMLNKIQLHEEANIDNMVQLLKESGYPNLERLDIRMMSMNGKLFTWVWTKS